MRSLALSSLLSLATVVAQAQEPSQKPQEVPCWQVPTSETAACLARVAAVTQAVSSADLLKITAAGTPCYRVSPADRTAQHCSNLGGFTYALPPVSNDDRTPCFQIPINQLVAKGCTPVKVEISPDQPCGTGHAIGCTCSCCKNVPALLPRD